MDKIIFYTFLRGFGVAVLLMLVLILIAYIIIRKEDRWWNITAEKDGTLAVITEKKRFVGHVKIAMLAALGQEILSRLKVGKLKKLVYKTTAYIKTVTKL